VLDFFRKNHTRAIHFIKSLSGLVDIWWF